MPLFCAVVGCASRGNRDNVRFFRIPAILSNRVKEIEALTRERRNLWVKSLKRGDLSDSYLQNVRICSKHFLTGEPAALEDRNNPDWVPTQNMGYVSSKSQKENAVERHKRVARRKVVIDKQRTEQSIAGPSTGPTTDHEDPLEYENETGIAVQTDLTMALMEKHSSDMQFSNEKITMLQRKLKALDLSEDAFKDDDVKTLYYTGLIKYNMMMLVFEEVREFLSTKSSLSPFKQFLLSMMKLRLNLPFKLLAYTFGVAPSTASDIFYKCIEIFYARFKGFVFWPERDTLRKNMPECFMHNFGDRVAVIIDCFEIFTETPSNLLNAARCWSNYKHHETVKILIGITPQGTISYISEAWGGRTSDKYLTENCGFLDNILPGDLILADRGFTISDSVNILGGHLQIPAFTKGKNQLSPVDLEATRKIANVRIHVERVIGLLRRKYKICKGPLPISMLCESKDDKCAFDKILTVTSAFVNMCPSVIPMD